MIHRVAFSVIVLLALPVTVHAEERLRDGLTFGLSLGAGPVVSECEACSATTSAVDLHIGWMAAPRLAVLFDMTGVVQTQGLGVSASLLYAGAAQYWATPRIWLKGGAGVALLEDTGVFGQMDTEQTGFGMLAAVGLEFLRAQRFVFDGQAQFAGSFYGQDGKVVNASLQIGISWY